MKDPVVFTGLLWGSLLFQEGEQIVDQIGGPDEAFEEGFYTLAGGGGALEVISPGADHANAIDGVGSAAAVNDFYFRWFGLG